MIRHHQRQSSLVGQVIHESSQSVRQWLIRHCNPVDPLRRRGVCRRPLRKTSSTTWTKSTLTLGLNTSTRCTVITFHRHTPLLPIFCTMSAVVYSYLLLSFFFPPSRPSFLPGRMATLTNTLRASHCTDYHVTSLLFLRVTCPCSLRTYATLKFIRSSSSSSSSPFPSSSVFPLRPFSLFLFFSPFFPSFPAAPGFLK